MSLCSNFEQRSHIPLVFPSGFSTSNCMPGHEMLSPVAIISITGVFRTLSNI